MYGYDIFSQALIYLLATVISVPLARKLGLGSVLGYLLAGVLIGPFALGLVGRQSPEVIHFAEFGVVLLLFIIGLELEPSLLWKMRRYVFGLGGLQVATTTVVIGLAAWLFGFKPHQSVAIGLILSLSSTAIVLQTLSEKGLLKNLAGRYSFSVLLFQDLLVIPILALLPVLASFNDTPVAGTLIKRPGQVAHVADMTAWIQLLVIVGVMTGIYFAGRFIARHIFRYVAESGIRELFTATALLMVIGIALAMEKVGLSPALGTFIAGVVLAENEYRHELETTVIPFKGLLLGLFFITVGASINLSLLFEKLATITGFVTLLILIKLTILYFLGKTFGLKFGRETLFAFALSQAGEFGFILVTFSNQNQIFNFQTTELMLIVISLSMAFTPLMLILFEKQIEPYYIKKRDREVPDDIKDQDHSVIIAGFGRFGLVVGRLLIANGFKVTILDSNPANVAVLRKYGFKLYYGDVTRPEMLEAAGAAQARLIILSMAEYDEAVKIAASIQKKYPNLKIAARTRDIYHTFQFYNLGIHMVQRESFNSALELGAKALHYLGFTRYQAYRASRTFKHHEEAVLAELYQHWQEDESRIIREARLFSEELDDIMQAEHRFSIHETDYAWDITSIRKEAKEDL